MLPSGIDVTPAYLEKLPKSAAVSKTQAGGGAADNSMHGNEATAQWAQLKFNQPTQRGPAITVHESSDELSGVVYFCMKSPSHYWHRQDKKTKTKTLLLKWQSDKEVGVSVQPDQSQEWGFFVIFLCYTV